MRFRSTLPLMAVGLVLSTSAFAQNAPDGAVEPPPPPMGGQAQGPLGSNLQMPAITQTSRIRAFNAAPDGQVRSLYLRNGSVVNVSPDLGRQLSTQAHRGGRISVTGTQTTVNGQRIIMASQITMNSQTYVAQLQGSPLGAAGVGPDGGPGMAPPPPPPPSPNARLNGPDGPRGPRPGRGPVPPAPPNGSDPQPGLRSQSVPPPPPIPGAPVGQPSGPGQRNMPAQGNRGGMPGQPNPNTPPPPAQGDPAATPGQPNPNPATGGANLAPPPPASL